MTHLKVFFRCWLSKATFECKLADVACTVAQVFFYFQKPTFTNIPSSIPESFRSDTVSCDWPVRNT